jgi:hypothetical protein
LPGTHHEAVLHGDEGANMRAGNLRGLALAVAMMAAAPAAAATQGSLGATSTGSVTITASIPARARISSLEDISFADQDPAQAASGSQDVCVWSNTLSRAYTTTASGSGTGGAFTLANGGREIPYSVQWAALGGGGGLALSSGVASTPLVTAATEQDCQSADSASLLVRIEPGDLQTMEPGATYAGALTLMVTPQ